MSFFFNWLDLEYTDIKSKLSDLLNQISNSSSNSQNLLDGVPLPKKIKLQQLTFGETAPHFEILDVPELTPTKFKGLFKFTYDGQLKLTINAEIEINALNLIPFDNFTKPHFVLSGKSTILPVDFEIKDLKIDALITVVYVKGEEELIVIFNDDPLIDLNLNTSIDELVDEELFESIKQDALMFAKEVIKDDLPKYLRDAHKFRDFKYDQNLLASELDKFQEKENDETMMMKAIDVSFTDFDTLSLSPMGFTDFCQKTCLSKFNQFDSTICEIDRKKYTRRKIKMSNLRKVTSSPREINNNNNSTLCSPSMSVSNSVEFCHSSNSSVKDNSSSILPLLPPVYKQDEPEEDTASQTPLSRSNRSLKSTSSSLSPLRSISKSQPSTPMSKTMSLESDSPISFYEITDNNPNNYIFTSNSQMHKMIDPYENLLHPKDLDLELLCSNDEFMDSEQEIRSDDHLNDSDDTYSLISGISSSTMDLPFVNKQKRKNKNENTKGFRSRLASSNYINLGEFKAGFLNKKEN